jgi:hypothetical protein
VSSCADPLGSPSLVFEAEGGGNVDQAQAAAALAAAPLRGEIENGVAAFPPAAEDAEQQACSAFPAADVHGFGGRLVATPGTPVAVRSYGESA